MHYIPKILIVGSLDEFRKKFNLHNMSAKIIGNVSFSGTFNNKDYELLIDNTILFNKKITKINKLIESVRRNDFDYLVFINYSDYMKYRDFLSKNIIESSQIITIDFLINNVKNCFYSYRNQYLLYDILERKNTISLLDFDSFFANGQMYLKPDGFSQIIIDGIGQPVNYPMINKFYEKIYSSLEDCRYCHYDTILLTSERSADELREVIRSTNRMTNDYVIFNKKTAEVVRNLLNEGLFTSAQAANCINGTYFILNNRKPENISIFVVTHKKHSLKNLPQGYINIHAGREISEDLGYLGDNTGDNISKLNPYINELTALYWIWKNTSYSYVGTAHYRRFFSGRNSYQFSEDSILKPQQAYELLQRYDILIGREGVSSNTQNSLIMAEDSDNDVELGAKAIEIVKNMIERYQPDYLDSFYKILYSQGFFYCNMLITRKHVYDAFCEWLFSFILPAVEEFLKVVAIDKLSAKQKRIIGFCAERMMSVWLLKQNLRLKDFPIMVDK